MEGSYDKPNRSRDEFRSYCYNKFYEVKNIFNNFNLTDEQTDHSNTIDDFNNNSRYPGGEITKLRATRASFYPIILKSTAQISWIL